MDNIYTGEQLGKKLKEIKGRLKNMDIDEFVDTLTPEESDIVHNVLCNNMQEIGAMSQGKKHKLTK